MAVTLLYKILWLNWSQFHFSQRIYKYQRLSEKQFKSKLFVFSVISMYQPIIFTAVFPYCKLLLEILFCFEHHWDYQDHQLQDDPLIQLL